MSCASLPRRKCRGFPGTERRPCKKGGRICAAAGPEYASNPQYSMRTSRILPAAAFIGIACAAYFVFRPATVSAPMTVSSPKADWTTDFEAAKADAAKSGRKLLLDFTGSDWCIYCQKLDAEVLSTPEFRSFAKDYVLVCLDFPKAKELPAAEKKQNDTLG